MTDINAIITERGSTYGDFARNAACSQMLKSIARGHNQSGMTDLHWEAVDMIFLKLSRIITGGPLASNHADSWDDIAGYAKLVADRVR